MRPYTNSLASVTASYPTAVYVPVERLNEADTYAPATETGTVPAGGNGYTAELNHGILQQSTLTVALGSTSLTAVPFEIAPSADEVAVHFDRGLLKFHSSRSGQAVSVTYQPLGSVASASFENRMQKEVAATQTAVSTLQNGTAADEFTVNSDKTDNDATLAFGRSGQTNPARLRWNKQYCGFYLLAGGVNDSGQANLSCNDLTIAGNLTVNGTVTSIETANTTIRDNIITLNDGTTGAPSTDAGIEVERGTSANAQWIWNEGTDSWTAKVIGDTYNANIAFHTAKCFYITGEAPDGSLNLSAATDGNINLAPVGTGRVIAAKQITGPSAAFTAGSGQVALYAKGASGQYVLECRNASNNLALGVDNNTAKVSVYGTLEFAAPATIQAAYTNGDLTLAPNGTGKVFINRTHASDYNDLLIKAGDSANCYTQMLRLENSSAAYLNVGYNTSSATWGIAAQGYHLTVSDSHEIRLNSGAEYGTVITSTRTSAGVGPYFGLKVLSQTNGTTGTITTLAGIYVPAVTKSSSITVTNASGIHIDAPTAGTNNYAATFGGALKWGVSGPVMYESGGNPIMQLLTNGLAFGVGAAQTSSSPGGYNFFIGNYSGYACSTSACTWNTGIGTNSLRYLTTGAYNTGVGGQACGSVTNGGYNVCLGYYAGAAGSSVGITTGSYNIAIGANTGMNVGAITGSYNCLIGSGADLSTGTRTGSFAIGYNARVDQDYSLCVGGGSQAYKVGVNVIAPTEALDVSGNAKISGTVTAGGCNLSRWRGSAASDPSNPVAGDLYFNTAGAILKIHDGTTWKTVV